MQPKKLTPINDTQYKVLADGERYLHNPALKETHRILKGGFTVPIHNKTFEALCLRGYIAKTGGEGNRLEYAITDRGKKALSHYIERQEKYNLASSGNVPR